MSTVAQVSSAISSSYQKPRLNNAGLIAHYSFQIEDILNDRATGSPEREP
jgi:hypothetical protein